MPFEGVLALIIAITTLLGGLLVPYLKKKGLWVVTLFAVNIIEQVCEFLELNGYGPKKYEFVKKILLLISPKLSDEEIDILIETLVDRLHQLQKEVNRRC